MPLGYTDKDALALVQTRDPRPVERGDVYEDVLPAAVQDDETEPLGGVVPLDRPLSRMDLPLLSRASTLARRTDGHCSISKPLSGIAS